MLSLQCISKVPATQNYNIFLSHSTEFSNLLSLSLWLGCRPTEDLFHSTSLGHVGLEILGGVCYPGRVKLGGVLVHQVGVFGASRSSKVLDLKTNDSTHLKSYFFISWKRAAFMVHVYQITACPVFNSSKQSTELQNI